MDIIVTVLSLERDHAREIVDAVIDAEQNYLFTNDADYKDNRQSIVPPTDVNQQPPPQQYDAQGKPIPPNPNQPPR